MKYINYINTISQSIRRKPLNTIEAEIIACICEGKTYLQIAEKVRYDDGYVGHIARELYGLVGQKHKVKVNRLNLVAVLDSVMGAELDDTFNACHGIKEATVFNNDILKFKQDEIVVSLSTFWKFDAKNNTLILKTKYPIVLSLNDLKTNPFKTILHLIRREQLSGDALLELFKILDNYYNETDFELNQTP